MKRALQLLALGVAMVTVIGWLAGGRNPGWTRTSVAVRRVDPVTELPYQEYERRFVPGVELLALGLVAAAGLMVVSWLVRHHPTR